MKAQEISKDSGIAGKGSYIVNEWPETDEEMLSYWGTSLVCNHAFKDIVIASRAKWEGFVIAYFIAHGKTIKKGKRIMAAPLADQSDGVIITAHDHATAEMLDWFPPIGEHTRLTEMDKAKRATDGLTDAQLDELIAARKLVAKGKK